MMSLLRNNQDSNNHFSCTKINYKKLTFLHNLYYAKQPQHKSHACGLHVQ